MSTQDQPCAGLPGVAQAVCGVPDAIGDAVGGAVTGAAGSAFDTAASGITRSAVFFVERLGDAMTATTRIDITSAWFLRQYGLMFGLSAFLTLALLLLSVLKEVVRGQWSAALRAGTVYYVAAVVASAFAPALVYVLLQLSDGLSAALAAGSGRSTDAFFDELGEALTGLTLATAQSGPFTLMVASLLTIGCALVLWVELLLRSAIVYVALLFAAPTFSGLVDRSLWRHCRTWLYFMISVVFAKPVVVAVLLLAAGATGDASTQDSFSSVFVGIALLLVAIFCVGLLFRLVPNAGDQMAGVLNARREMRAGTPNLPLPSPGAMVKQSLQTHIVQGVRRVAGPAPSIAGAATSVHRARPARPTSPAGGPA